MAVTTQSPLQGKAHWKERAIEASTVITDMWEVTKVYMGRCADWILFGCMIFNILQAIPGLNIWPAVVNGALVTQVLTLDICGFSLLTMANHAKKTGLTGPAKWAKWVAIALIGIMLVTVTLLTTKTLFPKTAETIDLVDKLLIIVRIGMVVVYGQTVHSLRHADTDQVPQVVQDRLATLVQSVVQSAVQSQGQLVQSAMLQLVQSELQLVQSEVKELVQSQFQGHEQAVQSLVQSVVQFDVNTLVQEAVQSAVQVQSHQLIEQLNAVRREVKREIKTTITEVQETSSASAVASAAASAVNSVQGSAVSRRKRETTPVTTLPGTVVIEETALDTTLPKTMQVVHYLTQQTALGNTPSLTDIEKAISCTRRTAIDGKREWERRHLLAAPGQASEE